MKVIEYPRYGPAEVLRVGERPVRSPGVDEVLVRVTAAGLNPADWRFRSGQFRFGMPLSFPFVPGNDFSGVVEQVGLGVSSLHGGEPVFGMTPLRQGGACAEFLTVAARWVSPAPSGLPSPKLPPHTAAARVAGCAASCG